MRWLLKSWQSDRPLKPDSKRVRWYDSENDIRLVFEDKFGKTERFYDNRDEAQLDWEAFIDGKLTVRYMKYG